MPKDADAGFYERADAHIHLANDQLKEVDDRGMVSASTMYAVSRFNTWVSACGFPSGDDMALAREEVIEYFAAQYRLMLEENFDDYVQNFSKYMEAKH